VGAERDREGGLAVKAVAGGECVPLHSRSMHTHYLSPPLHSPSRVQNQYFCGTLVECVDWLRAVLSTFGSEANVVLGCVTLLERLATVRYRATLMKQLCHKYSSKNGPYC
jgi:hypothetical protein